MYFCNEIYCNNCGKMGHLYSQCKIPITSIGVLAFRYVNSRLEYLMIRRKETHCYVDFIRGKYSLGNKEYLLEMLNEMTVREKNNILTRSFEELWIEMWADDEVSTEYKTEYYLAKDKFEILVKGYNKNNIIFTIEDLIKESKNNFTEPEWGFPKGRRNTNEKDYDCAIREFCEETGYRKEHLQNMHNIMPLYEFFTGSNYKCYKHKYFVMYMQKMNTLNESNYQKSEVSEMVWMPIDKAIDKIREYNVEKKNVLIRLDKALTASLIYFL